MIVERDFALLTFEIIRETRMETLAAKKSGQKKQMSTGFSTVRLIVTAVVIVACFSALYPKFFHPIVIRMLGLSQPKQKTESIPSELVLE